MGQFIKIATERNEHDEIGLVAVFKGCVIHIAVNDVQTLMKASSRFQKSHLNDSAAVPKEECWRAITAWSKAEMQIKNGEINADDLPKISSFDSVWHYRK